MRGSNRAALSYPLGRACIHAHPFLTPRSHFANACRHLPLSMIDEGAHGGNKGAAQCEKSVSAAIQIGIDFDNTLINYDRVFLAAARERGLINNGFQGSKRAVRDAIRRLPDGELTWQRLQGYVYGRGIGGAVPFDGVPDFLRRCYAQKLTVSIVSHKTRYGHHDPAQIDLREAALGWMRVQGFFQPEGGVPVKHVFFEDTQGAKLARIVALGCTHFIDDLEEVFADPSFPSGVKRILFAPDGSPSCDVVCASWTEITAAIFYDGS
jgi:hypothetical protein